MPNRYELLMQMVVSLTAVRQEIGVKDGPSVTSPKWRFVNHIINYLDKEADTVLRGEEEV